MKIHLINRTLFLLAIGAFLLTFNSFAYADSLSELKDSLNKGEIDPAVIEEPGQQSDNISNASPGSTPAIKTQQKLQKPVINKKNNKPLQPSGLSHKTIKIKVKGKYKIITVPISNRSMPEESSFMFSELPAFPPTEDKTKLEAIAKLTNLHSILPDASTSYDTGALQAFYEIIYNYPQYPDVCAAAKLYYTEYQMKFAASIGDCMQTAEMFNQIIELCANDNSSVCKFIVNKITADAANDNSKITAPTRMKQLDYMMRKFGKKYKVLF